MHIIGAGRVGGALSTAAQQTGQAATLLSRDSDWSVLEDSTGPILVATRNDDLADVLARVPESRHGDLVFIQNGMIRPWLADNGLADATRGLLFFAVPSRGAAIQPGPPSPFHGPHAQAVVRFLRAIGVPAEEVSAAAFTDLEHEKLLWNTVFGLCCQAFDATVGQVVREHADPLRALTEELDAVGRAAMDVTIDFERLFLRLCDYSLSIADYQGAVKEWRWRNGWYVGKARAMGRTLPMHSALCARAGVSG